MSILVAVSIPLKLIASEVALIAFRSLLWFQSGYCVWFVINICFLFPEQLEKFAVTLSAVRYDES